LAKVKLNCELCGSEYQHGPEVYEGHKLELYGDIFCCDICWQGNWDGWGPDPEKLLLKILKEKELPVPERNAKGWLPRN